MFARLVRRRSLRVAILPPLAALAAIVLNFGVADATTLSISGSMEGNLPVTSGDTLQAGYDFTIPGNNQSVTVRVTMARVVIHVDCGDQLIKIPFYKVVDNTTNWYPSGDQSSPLVWQGSTIASCTGHAPKGATFSANFTSSPAGIKLNVRFHFRDNTSGSWSGTASVITSPFSTPTPTPTPGE